MYPIHFDDIDLGDCHIEMEFFQRSEDGIDMAGIKFEFYGITMNFLGVDSGSGLLGTPSNIWYLRTIDVPIPVGTRFVRVIPEFLLITGNDINANIDSINTFIRKGPIATGFDKGPSFEQWRVNFVQANTWSGCAVSEVAFRNSEGGLTITTGGSPVFGSAGLGVANADAAFDGVANTNYWAGEEFGVTLGTAWVGYNFGTPVRPVELAITARLGSDAYMVGSQFYIEGSHDGVNWTKVRYVPGELNPLFNTGETRAFPIPSGTISKGADYHVGGGYTYARTVNSADDYNNKGNVYQAYTRFTLTHLCALVNHQAAGTFNYELQLYRCNTQKNGSSTVIGMITEHLETISATSLLQDADEWVTKTCVGVHEFEVGEYFVVRFVDLDAATNPEDTNEGRILYLTGLNGEPADLFERRKNIAKLVGGFYHPDTLLELGDVNTTGAIAGIIWGVDFQVTMY